ncbi:ferredoxin [Saccharothrix sp. ST-888]|uniref:ferredoxin n=1 Tax=Saccharothrix sp. ST-888 TaxID=1427391 RepID=UPI0005EC79D6|nr:ferredoxin [Saccharothrix sp. ST-888]KJK59349.1 ferredoxin [Saccharothrix sp. ST-888]
MHVTIDQDRCCGAGQCVLTAPTVFDQGDDDGLVRLRTDRPEPAVQSDVRLAAALCPGGAITVHDSNT